MKKTFMENKKGVHLMCFHESEHAVCGDAFDIGEGYNPDDPDNPGMMEHTDKRTVTCPDCIIQILNCRNVKIDMEILNQ